MNIKNDKVVYKYFKNEYGKALTLDKKLPDETRNYILQEIKHNYFKHFPFFCFCCQ